MDGRGLLPGALIPAGLGGTLLFFASLGRDVAQLLVSGGGQEAIGRKRQAYR